MFDSETKLTGHERRRLREARENGYLKAGYRNAERLIAAHARWCWRLRVPLVWTEGMSRYSRYGRVRVDLYTTSFRLNPAGEAELRALAVHARTSAHDASWERVPRSELDVLARAAYRTAMGAGNYEANRAAIGARPFLVGYGKARERMTG
jgi:hypothetical protein